ncbi:MAG: aminotransferase class V-fold PLP-dependent enzyme [Pseudomonadota bacterium]
MTNKPFRPATIAAQAGGAKGAGGAVVPGLEVATTFARDANYALTGDGSYGRDRNATVVQVEEVLRQLEGAAETRLFGSGMAAAAAVFQALPNGARAVVQAGIYWGVTHWLAGFCAKRAIPLDTVDAADPAAIEAALADPADLVWIEVPSNPWIKIADIARVAELAHAAGALLAVDGTAATPVLTQSLALGADISMHSGTKAINGHSDVIAGVLSCRQPDLPLWRDICAQRAEAGALLGPMEAWLLMRGMRTLPLRIERMCATAQKVATAMHAHPFVETVWYPGLSDHPGHELAQKQMCGGAGYLMSVLIKGGADDALGVAGRLQLIHRATSLGGTETLVEHRATVEPQSGIPGNLLRLSIGLEDPEDLIADLDQALRG